MNCEFLCQLSMKLALNGGHFGHLKLSQNMIKSISPPSSHVIKVDFNTSSFFLYILLLLHI